MEVDRDKYRRWLMDRRSPRGRARSPSPPSSSSAPGTQGASGEAPAAEGSLEPLERVKWWLGIRNSYYRSDWP